MSLLDVSSILATGSWAQKKGANERPQAFVNVCIDGYTGHLIGAPYFSLLEIVCVGDLGDRTHGDRICWDLFGKPRKRREWFQEKQEAKYQRWEILQCLGSRWETFYVSMICGSNMRKGVERRQ